MCFFAQFLNLHCCYFCTIPILALVQKFIKGFAVKIFNKKKNRGTLYAFRGENIFQPKLIPILRNAGSYSYIENILVDLLGLFRKGVVVKIALTIGFALILKICKVALCIESE